MKQYVQDWNKLQNLLVESSSGNEEESTDLPNYSGKPAEKKSVHSRHVRRSSFNEDGYIMEMSRKPVEKPLSARGRIGQERSPEPTLDSYVKEIRGSTTSIHTGERKPLAERKSVNSNNEILPKSGINKPPTGLKAFRTKVVKKGFASTRTSMQKLDVSGITDQDLEELFQRKSEDLKVVTNYQGFEKFVKNIKTRSTEDKLTFLESGFGPLAISTLSRILLNNHQITQLTLRNSFLNGNAAQILADALSQMKNLIHVDLANNNLDSKDFEVIFSSLKKSITLISIDISNYDADKKNKFGCEAAAALSNLCDDNPCLQYIKLNNLMIDDTVMEVASKGMANCPSLLGLSLVDNVCTGKTIGFLRDVFIRTELEFFDISNNKMGAEANIYFSTILKVWKSQMRNDMILNLQNTNLSDKIHELFEVLARDITIVTLNLSQNILTETSTFGLDKFIGDNHKLIELNLSNCRLGEEGGKLLASGIERNKGIQILLAGNNNFGDETGSIILTSIMKSLALKHIDLSRNKLGKKSAAVILEMIKTNNRILKYQLSNNNFEEHEGYLIQEALYTHSNITMFDIHNNPVKYTNLEGIAAIIKENQRRLYDKQLPKLRTDIDYTQSYVSNGVHAIEDVVENTKKQGELKDDIVKYKGELKELRIRPVSPTITRKQEIIDQNTKHIEQHNQELAHLNIQIKEVTKESRLERDGYIFAIEELQAQIKDLERQMTKQTAELDKVSAKYDPEVKLLRKELAQVLNDNRYTEVYIKTLNEKIKKKKQRIDITHKFQAPKISDMFLASSVLAQHKKKSDDHALVKNNQSKMGTTMDSQPRGVQVGDLEDSKVAREYEFALKNQKERVKKAIEEAEEKQEKKKKKKKRGQFEDPYKMRIQEEINKKIKELEKDKNLLPLEDIQEDQ